MFVQKKIKSVGSDGSAVRFFKKIVRNCGFEISRYLTSPSDGSLNLNIGSGGYSIDHFINLDFPSKWYGMVQNRTRYIKFDARIDLLPFEDNSVHNIYISHVVEHLETDIVSRLLGDAIRTLKPGGVIRICTPDAYFLYDISRFQNNFNDQLKHNFEGFGTTCDIDPIDFLTYEIASFSKIHNPLEESFSKYLADSLHALEFEEFMNIMTSKKAFNPEYPGQHISWWSFEKISKLMSDASSSPIRILLSKYQGSVSPKMRGSQFDKTVPFLSLYVEIIKLSDLV